MEAVASPVDTELHRSCRQEIHSWRSLHARAVEREAAWKQEAQQLQQRLAEREAECTQLRQQVESLKAKLSVLQKLIFGRKSERREEGAAPTPCTAEQSLGETPRARGQKKGSPGHGRRCHPDLPTEEVSHELPPEHCRCPRCGNPFKPFPGTEDSEEIHWEVHVVRRLHKRGRYQPTCTCGGVPGIVTAPCPPKLIPKGKFSVGFWVNLLLEKYLLQRPLYRVRWLLSVHGLNVSQGTLTGGLERLLPLLLPLYAKVLERSRGAAHWHMDETRWMVFVEVEGKPGHRWWLWVVVTQDTVVFLLEPTRCAEVPSNHLGEDAQGILSVDRYSAYKALADASDGRILVAFCWSHQRRDFIRVRDGYRRLSAWAQGWVDRIHELYAFNDRRLAVRTDPQAFATEDSRLRQAVAAMAELRDRQMEDPALHPAQRKALKSLRGHWGGLTLFVDHPEIPMDNNESERRLRNPVVGRKNYNWSGSLWSGTLSAVCFTLLQTCLKNGLDPQKFLHAYLQACAENGGRPPDNIDRFLPWNLSPEHKADWALPP